MIIAVDTDDLREEPGNFLNECLQRIIPASSQHTFILLSKINAFSSYEAYKNCVLISLIEKNYLLSLLEINRILKKQKADILLTGNALSAAFSNTKCGFITSSLHLILHKKTLNKFLNNILLKRCYQKASLIFTAWEIERKNIIAENKLNKVRVQAIHYGLNDIQPALHFEQHQIIKSDYAEGYAYFLVAQSYITPGELLIFLKAFSIFKKKLKSSMKLLVDCGNYKNDHDELNKVLKDYRFKSDVILAKKNQAASTELFQGAYAIIFNNLQANSFQSALKALAASTPVICFKGSIEEEIFDKAALYYDEFVADQIAARMILMYKDEDLKKALSANEQVRHSLFSWDRSATRFMHSIENALS